MSDRVVVVLARPSPSLPAELTAAMLEDVIVLVTGYRDGVTRRKPPR